MKNTQKPSGTNSLEKAKSEKQATNYHNVAGTSKVPAKRHYTPSPQKNDPSKETSPTTSQELEQNDSERDTRPNRSV